MAKRFAYGWGFHSIIAIFLSIPVILRNPRKLGLLLSSNKHVKFGAFLASLAGIYQVNVYTLSKIYFKNRNYFIKKFASFLKKNIVSIRSDHRQSIVCCDE